jgi:hypothetical protein
MTPTEPVPPQRSKPLYSKVKICQAVNKFLWILEVRTEEIFRWIVSLQGSSKLFVLCAVGERRGQAKHAHAELGLCGARRVGLYKHRASVDLSRSFHQSSGILAQRSSPIDFSADRPIQSRDADLLDRRGFAKYVAAALRGWTGRDSLVLALYGEGREQRDGLVDDSGVKHLQELCVSKIRHAATDGTSQEIRGLVSCLVSG